MGFSKMIELLQKKKKGYIILVNCGSFYIAKGKDALCLNKILGLKLSHMETEVCKVGFPIKSLEKYSTLIKENNYSYVVYKFDSNASKLEILEKYDGKYFNNINEERGNCYICKNTVKMYKKEDKYIQAVSNLYKEEMELEVKNKKEVESGLNLKKAVWKNKWFRKK